MMQTVWGWQPAIYLFLGGMGAGAFVMAALLYLKHKDAYQRIISCSMWVAVVSLIVGLLLLLMELVTPLRGLLMWQSFSHMSSWMTYGAWGAFGAIIAFGLSAVFATPKINAWLQQRCSWFKAHQETLRSVLAVIGIVLGLFVAVYTGMLLKTSNNVPFWNTYLLPALFTVSALDTGIAAVELVVIAHERKEELAATTKRFVYQCVVCLVVLEVIVLAVLLGVSMAGGAGDAITQTAAQSAAMLVTGDLAVLFWGLVVILGLVFPLVVAVKELMDLKKAAKPEDTDASNAQKTDTPKHVNTLGIIGAGGALIGGCALRFLVLAVGIHADVVAETILHMIG